MIQQNPKSLSSDTREWLATIEAVLVKHNITSEGLANNLFGFVTDNEVW